MTDDTTDDTGSHRPTGGREPESYLDTEINLFSPATPFMRDHLKLVWGTFLLWVLFVFGPVTATAIAPELMTGTIVLGFQLHFLLTAIGAPFGALLLSIVYAAGRDRLDEKYDISHATERVEGDATTAAADGGEPR
jgi:putative solute:sodium symporter small subunit